MEVIRLAPLSHGQQLSLLIYVRTLNRNQSKTEDSRTLVSGFCLPEVLFCVQSCVDTLALEEEARGPFIRAIVRWSH